MYRHKSVFKPFVLVSCLMSLALFANAVKAQEVNVYSARKEALIMPLLEKFKGSKPKAVRRRPTFLSPPTQGACSALRKPGSWER